MRSLIDSHDIILRRSAKKADQWSGGETDENASDTLSSDDEEEGAGDEDRSYKGAIKRKAVDSDEAEEGVVEEDTEGEEVLGRGGRRKARPKPAPRIKKVAKVSGQESD